MPGALLDSAVITMTPLKSMSGIPDGGLVAGVEITPGGLEMDPPATLEIVAKQTVPLERQLALTAGESGSQVLPALLNLNQTRTELYLSHFSVWSIASVGDTGRAMIFQQRIDNAAARSRAELAAAFQSARTAGTSGAGGSAHEAFIAAQERYYVEVIIPALDTAEALAAGGASTEVVRPGVTLAFDWARSHELLRTPGMEELVSEAFDRIHGILEDVWGSTFTRCANEPTPRRVRELYAAARHMQLLGFPDEFFDGFDLTQCKGAIWKGTIIARQELRSSLGGLSTWESHATVTFAGDVYSATTLVAQTGSSASYNWSGDWADAETLCARVGANGSFFIGATPYEAELGYAWLSISDAPLGSGNWVYRLAADGPTKYVELPTTCGKPPGPRNIGFGLELWPQNCQISPQEERPFRPILGISGVVSATFPLANCWVEWKLEPGLPSFEGGD